jgi:hypothetical protein
MLCRGVGAYVSQHVVTADPRQFQIEKDDGGEGSRIAAGMRTGGEEIVECLLAIAHDGDVADDIAAREGAARQLDIVVIVFDKQDCPVRRTHDKRLPEALLASVQ